MEKLKMELLELNKILEKYFLYNECTVIYKRQGKYEFALEWNGMEEYFGLYPDFKRTKSFLEELCLRK